MLHFAFIKHGISVYIEMVLFHKDRFEDFLSNFDSDAITFDSET